MDGFVFGALLVFGLLGAPVALLIFDFGSGLLLASLLSDLLLWLRALRRSLTALRLRLSRLLSWIRASLVETLRRLLIKFWGVWVKTICIRLIFV